MTFPYYASAEQIMRDRSELARKGIGRGRSVIVQTLTIGDGIGVLFVADNPSSTLNKVSEIYDRIGFAAAGKYNEFESLRRAGIQHADNRGYAYGRNDVTGRSLANAYAATLGTVFTEQPKPYEVELCVAEVAPIDGSAPAQLYRIGYDGSIADERNFLVMGGNTEPIVAALKDSYSLTHDLGEAFAGAVAALRAGRGDGDPALRPADLEVAILDPGRVRRAFRRVDPATLLPPASDGPGSDGPETAPSAQPESDPPG